MGKLKGWSLIGAVIAGLVLGAVKTRDFFEQLGLGPAATQTESIAEAPQASHIITVPGTGTLETENGMWFVRGMGQPEVELGRIDTRSLIRTENSSFNFGKGLMVGFREHYLNQRVTVIATVEVVVDNEKVFRPIRTVLLTIFRHSDGRPEQ